MSDIHVDKLNNSQLILLVLLISLVVSAAVAVATLSVVYERLALADSEESTATQPTVIQQTINRIIERSPVLPVDGESVTESLTSEQTDLHLIAASSGSRLTLENIEKASVQLYFGSQPFASGIYISPEGLILSAEPLDKERRYSVSDTSGDMVYFSPVYTDAAYSLLAPMREHTVSHYVPLGLPVVSLGQSVLAFGGFGEGAQLYVGVVSQKKTTTGGVTSFRFSGDILSVAHTSAVFVDAVFVGFVVPFSDWVTVVTSDLMRQSQQSYDHTIDVSS